MQGPQRKIGHSTACNRTVIVKLMKKELKLHRFSTRIRKSPENDSRSRRATGTQYENNTTKDYIYDLTHKHAKYIGTLVQIMENIIYNRIVGVE